MAFAFVDSASSTINTTSNSTSLTIPAGTSAGDLMVLHVLHRSALDVPAGWTLLQTSDSFTNTTPTTQYQSMLMKIADGGDASSLLTVTQASSTIFDIHVQVFSSASPAVVYRVYNDVINSDANALTTMLTYVPISSALMTVGTSFILATNPTTITFDANWTRTAGASAAFRRLGAAYRLPAAGFRSVAITNSVTATNNRVGACTAVFLEQNSTYNLVTAQSAVLALVSEGSNAKVSQGLVLLLGRRDPRRIIGMTS